MKRNFLATITLQFSIYPIEFLPKGTTFNRLISNKNSSHCSFVSSPAPKLEVVCYKCHQSGHYANHCTKANFSKSRYNRSRPRGSNAVRGADCYPQAHLSFTLHIFIAKTSLSLKSYNSDVSWIFDTAATHHSCKDKSFLWDYEILKN